MEMFLENNKERNNKINYGVLAEAHFNFGNTINKKKEEKRRGNY